MTDNGFKALQAWIEKNQAHFTGEAYTNEDIAKLAIACGFDRQAVAQWQTQQKFREVA